MTTNPFEDILKPLAPLIAYAHMITDAAKGFDPDLGETEESEENQPEPDTRLVRVKDLRLGDRVVLKDGAWEVTGLNIDGFAEDRVEVSLSNAEVYDMVTFAYVDVEN